MKLKLLRIAKTLLLLSTLGCAGAVLWSTVHYVRTSPRFSVKQISLRGLKRADEDDVKDRVRLRTDSNTNIFSIDMEDVRARVEQNQWVQYAMVQRVLPDQIVIRVVEREPIGLARIQGHIYEFDKDAAILEPDPASPPNLPILDGLVENETEKNLKKIAMYRKVIADLGADGLSEIMVNQANEVSVLKIDDSMVVNLGLDDFKERWSHYLSLKPKIDSEYKDAVRVDLRFRNKVIISMQNDDDGGKVIWDGKKKSL